MNLPDNLINHPWPFFSHFVLFTVVIWSIWTAPWFKIKKADSQHVFFGAIVILSLVWNVQAGISPGLNFHFLGTMIFYLLFGRQFALFALMIVLLVVTINGNSGWETYSLNILLMAVIPLTLCHALYSFSDSKLPNNYFVYVLVNGFFGAAMALLSCLLSNLFLMIVTDVYNYDYLAYEYLPFFPLIILPEALLSGILMSIFVAFCPGWVSTFDDNRYLKGK